MLLITQGKTKAARRVLPLSPRVRSVLENRWKLAKKPSEGWVWPAETKEHINHDRVKLQHKKALKDVWTLARIAGHSNISISQRYVHPSEDAVLNALSRLDGHNIRHSLETTTPTTDRELPLSDTATLG